MEAIDKAIHTIRRRFIFFRVLDWSLRGAFWALVVGLVVVLVGKLVVLPFNPLELVGITFCVAVLVAAIAAAAKGLPMFEAAMRADSKLALRERLSSAYALRASAKSPEISALLEDASAFASKIRVSQDFRYTAPREARFLALPLVAILAAHFLLGEMNLFGTKPVVATTPPAIAQQVRRTDAEHLKKIAQEAKLASEKDEDLARVATELERLSRDVSLGTKDRRAAAAEMSRLSEDIKLEQRKVERTQDPFKALSGLQKAAMTRDLRKDMKDQKFEDAAEKMEQLAQKIQDSGSMTPEDASKLGDELKDLADQMKDNPQLAEAMKKAADAVKKASDEKKENQKQSADGQQQGSNSSDSSKDGSQSGSKDSQQAGSQSASKQSSSMPGIEAAAALRQAASAMKDQQSAKELMQKLDQIQGQMQAQQSKMMNESGSQGQSQSSQMGESASGKSTDGQMAGNEGKQGDGGKNPANGGKDQGDGQSAGEQVQSGQGGEGSSKQDGNGNSPWSENMQPSEGPGMGAGGIGHGGKAPDDGSRPLGWKDTLVQGQKNKDGEIIAVIEINAPAPIGESNVEYRQVFNAYQQKAAQTLKSDVIPMTYRNQVRDYFEAINPQRKTEKSPK